MYVQCTCNFLAHQGRMQNHYQFLESTVYSCMFLGDTMFPKEKRDEMWGKEVDKLVF